MGKIKILFTIPNFDTAGSSKVVYDLVNKIDKDQFTPEICCHRDGGEFFNKVKNLGVPIHVFPLSPSYHPYYKIPYHIYKTYKFFKKHQFDIIHSWHWSSDIIEPLAARLTKIPFVYTKKAMSWGSRSWFWRSKLSTKIITINKDMISAFFQDMEHKVVYIPLGVDVEYFNPKSCINTIPDSMTESKVDFNIVTIANLVEVKGIELLIEAVKKIKNTPVKLWIVGNNNNAYGQGLIKKYASNEIQFLGSKQDVRPYLTLADAFVIPTKDEGRKEGLPVAPMEAMAYGKVVLGSEIAGIKDLLENFKECLFQPGNVNDLHNKLMMLINKNPKERFQLGLKMQELIKNKYAIETCVKTHEDLYTKLA